MTTPRVRLALVWFTAALVSLLGCLVGFAVWAVGLGQYLQDYCFTRVSPPVEDGIRGPFLEWPATVRCDYDRSPDVAVTDPGPLLWTAGLALTVLAGIATVVWLARVVSRRIATAPPS